MNLASEVPPVVESFGRIFVIFFIIFCIINVVLLVGLRKRIAELATQAGTADHDDLAAPDTDAETAKQTGKPKGSIFDALEDLDFAECLDKCIAISKA